MNTRWRLPRVAGYCSAAVAATCLAAAAPARTYFVDYEAGDDGHAGTSAQAAWKHCPGDPEAVGAAKAAALAPGDRVLFKGGVRYRGAVTLKASGTAAAPIVLDGNSGGTFGRGRAILDGSAPVTGWKRCASAAEARGNPRWASIYYADVPAPDSWRSLNLCDAAGPMPVAQSPNPSDPMFQERVGEYYRVDAELASDLPMKVYPEKGTHVNSRRPLIHVVAPGRGSAVVSPVVGGAFSVELDRAATVGEVGIFLQPRYTPVRQMEVRGDGKLLHTATLTRDAGKMERFRLVRPATVRKFTFTFLSTHGAIEHDWTAIRQVGAFTADGTNVLEASPTMHLTDPNALTARNADYYSDMMLALHGGHNMVHYLRITAFDPKTHRLSTEFFGDKTYPQTRYALFNSVKLIDAPGEYSVEPTGEAKARRVFVMPRGRGDGRPVGLSRSVHGHGIALRGAGHVRVRGFRIERQGGRRAAGLTMTGPAPDVQVLDCEVTNVRGGAAIDGVKLQGVRIDGAHVHHNPGHTKGLVLRDSSDCVTTGCRFVKNTSTGLDYYNVHGGRVADNLVTGHFGMHANGITFYLGCRDLVIERNLVREGNVCLTIQQAENVVIRNNVFDGGGRSMAVGIWTATPLRNVRFYHNAMIRSDRRQSWAVGLFSNNGGPEGLLVRNNIIDGRAGTLPGQFSHNLYTRLGEGQTEKDLGPGESYVPDLRKIMRDPAGGDYRLRAGSPATDRGTDLGVLDDLSGAKRPQGAAPDIGPHELGARPVD